MATLSARFIRALRALEIERDLQPMVELYTIDCELAHPMFDHLHGSEGVRKLWRKYLDSFEEIRTEFVSAVDGHDISVIEWISSATTLDGHPLEYGGASVLASEDNRITSMHVYFDPRAVIEATRREATPIRIPGRPDSKTA
jgi:ketosteroid isomerase-like protein